MTSDVILAPADTDASTTSMLSRSIAKSIREWMGKANDGGFLHDGDGLETLIDAHLDGAVAAMFACRNPNEQTPENLDPVYASTDPNTAAEDDVNSAPYPVDEEIARLDERRRQLRRQQVYDGAVNELDNMTLYGMAKGIWVHGVQSAQAGAKSDEFDAVDFTDFSHETEVVFSIIDEIKMRRDEREKATATPLPASLD